jgi:hypothetical protein
VGAARPPHDPPPQATPVTHPRRQPAQSPRRARRWRQPLAAGLTLVLVAALVPRALADDSGPAAASGTGESQTFEVTAEAEALTETFEPDLRQAEAPAAPERAGADGGDEPAADPAEVAQDSGSGERSTGEQEQPPPREPVVVAERDLARQEQSDRHDATGTGGVGGDVGKPPPAGQDQADLAGQDLQADVNQGCGAGGGCSTEPQGAGASTVAAAGGVAGGGGVTGLVRRLVTSGLEKLGIRQPPEPTPEQRERVRRMDLVEGDVRIIERREELLIADGRRVRSASEQVDDLVAQERAGHQIDLLRGSFEVEGWAAATPEEQTRFTELERRWMATWNMLVPTTGFGNPSLRTPLDEAELLILDAEVRQGLVEAMGIRDPERQVWGYYWSIVAPGMVTSTRLELEQALAKLEEARSQGVVAGSPKANQLADLELRAGLLQQQLASESPREDTPMTAVESDIRVVERLRGIREAQGRTRTPAEREDARIRLDRAFAGIHQLQPQVQGTDDAAALADLTRRAEEAELWLEFEGPPEGLPESWRVSPEQRWRRLLWLGLPRPPQMSMLDLEEVARLSQLPGHRPLDPKELDPNLPGQPIPDPEKVNPSSEGHVPPKVDTGRPHVFPADTPVDWRDLTYHRDGEALTAATGHGSTGGAGGGVEIAKPLGLAGLALAVVSVLSRRGGPTPPTPALQSVLPWLVPPGPGATPG